jgi:hypothetical protein
LYSRALCARCSQVAGRAVAVADPGELHLRPLAVKVGEAEGPNPVTALAHDQIKPVAVRMNASLQQFNLVRIECHFNVPVPLTTYRFFVKNGRCSAKSGDIRIN